MQRWKNILFNVSLALNCLLLFLVLFESRLAIPVWLQVTGRMHPLILHFPVVLVVLYALTVLLMPPQLQVEKKEDGLFPDVLLLLAAFTAVITALMGLFLSREQGYDHDALLWHKWGGVAVSFFTLGWYYVGKAWQPRRVLSFSTAILALALIIFTGHQGAGITHGQNFLWAPMMPEKKEQLPSLEKAEIYANMVQPILESKCMSCHNAKKAKGELVMETEALLLKGGKSGALWNNNAADLGLLLRRVHLPLEEKKHMPPQGKPQLTEEEIQILALWIRKGTPFKGKVTDLPAGDSLRQLAQQLFAAPGAEEYDFAAADPATIKKLNTVNRVVTEEALHSPALSVSFFNGQLYQPAQLKELSSVKEQIVSLNLARMPVKDDELKLIAGYPNLRDLNLNFTDITGATLDELKKLKYLHTLSLSGTRPAIAALTNLHTFPALKTVYAWNLPLSASEWQQIKQSLKGIRLETGFRGDTMVLKLSPPVVLNEQTVINRPVGLQLKHYIHGVTIRYTLDGSEPDSLHSPVFNGKETLDGNVLVRAKAFKTGWISSDVIESQFYKSTYRPDSAEFIIAPDPGYTGDPHMLADLEMGTTQFRNGGWLAWRQTKMEVRLRFAAPTTIRSVMLSGLLDVGSYIMPPATIEIWGGNDPGNLKLLTRNTPPQPGQVAPAVLKAFECSFDPVSVRYIRIVATPVAKLPSWHPGKGDNAWVFVDEILVN